MLRHVCTVAAQTFLRNCCNTTAQRKLKTVIWFMCETALIFKYYYIFVQTAASARKYSSYYQAQLPPEVVCDPAFYATCLFTSKTYHNKNSESIAGVQYDTVHASMDAPIRQVEPSACCTLSKVSVSPNILRKSCSTASTGHSKRRRISFVGRYRNTSVRPTVYCPG